MGVGWQGGRAAMHIQRPAQGIRVVLGGAVSWLWWRTQNLHRWKHSIKLSTHPEADANTYGKCGKSERGGSIESASTSWWWYCTLYKCDHWEKQQSLQRISILSYNCMWVCNYFSKVFNKTSAVFIWGLSVLSHHLLLSLSTIPQIDDGSDRVSLKVDRLILQLYSTSKLL